MNYTSAVILFAAIFLAGCVSQETATPLLNDSISHEVPAKQPTPHPTTPRVEPSEQLCKQLSWPPDCSMISEPGGRDMCIQCRQYLGSATSGPPAGISCGGRKEFFTVSPIAISDLFSLYPLGNLNPTGHVFPTDHIYFYTADATSQTRQKVTLLSPGNITITGMSSSEYISDTTYTDYQLEFTVCKDVRGKFGHVSSLSEKLLSQFKEPYGQPCTSYGTGGQTIKRCEKTANIEVQAGEIIGTVSGLPRGSTALDLWMYDYRTEPLAYANPSRWRDGLYIACPLDYFTEGVRKSLLTKLGYGGEVRTIPPLCGEAMQDKTGTAQGNWFLKGTTSTYPEDPHTALVHDPLDPQKGVFSVGTSLSKSGVAPGTYYFTPQTSGTVNRDFRDVKPDGKVYCYQTAGRFGGPAATILVQLTSPTTIRIEGASSCSGFTDRYSDFER